MFYENIPELLYHYCSIPTFFSIVNSKSLWLCNGFNIGNYMLLKGYTAYSTAWWKSFNAKLKLFANKRNKCCHPQWFKWNDMRELLSYEFKEDGSDVDRTPKIGGVFYECENGKKLDN